MPLADCHAVAFSSKRIQRTTLAFQLLHNITATILQKQTGANIFPLSRDMDYFAVRRRLDRLQPRERLRDILHLKMRIDAQLI